MKLNNADPDFIDTLRAALPARCFREITEDYLTEPRGRHHGRAGAVLAPANTSEVAVILRACAEARVPVVPRSGGTGLVGGQVMEAGALPVILSMERMTAIRDLRVEANVLICDAGAILQTVQEAAEAAGRLFPLSLASQGSARIGGLLSTNAGGVGVLRYGNARDLVLGIEAVLPNGDVLHGLSGLRKDNTGYDLRHLLMGAEGTLGVITGAALKLSPRPASVAVALLAVPGPEAALSLLSMARDHVGEGVSAFELIHRMGQDFLTETMPDVRLPMASPPEWSVLVELGLSGMLAPEALEGLLEAAMEAGLVTDGLIAQSEGQARDFWHMRETIPEANKRIGAICSHDISLPLGKLAGFIETGFQALAKAGRYRVNCFGHLGDGNLHYNVYPPKGGSKADFADQAAGLSRIVHDLVHEMGGSFSAEHGVGRLKVDDLERYGDPAKLTAMRAIKAALDPVGIMNPGAVLRG